MNRVTLKCNLRKAKLTFQGIGVILLSSALLLVGTKMSQTQIDLHSVGHISGTVPSWGKTSREGWLDNLVNRPYNQDQQYLLYRLSQKYKSIIDNNKPGTAINIYYNPVKTFKNEYTIYQVEVSGRVMLYKTEYEHDERNAGRYLVIPCGLFLMFFGCKEVIKRFYGLEEPAN